MKHEILAASLWEVSSQIVIMRQHKENTTEKLRHPATAYLPHPSEKPLLQERPQSTPSQFLHNGPRYAACNDVHPCSGPHSYKNPAHSTWPRNPDSITSHMQQLLKLIAKLAANCRLRDISHKGLLALLYPRRYPRWLWRLV